MRILVLGSSGLIGSPTCDYLRRNGHEVILFDLENGQEEDLSVYNPLLREKLNQCDFVYYFASVVGGAKYLGSRQNSFDFIVDNIDIMSNTFKALKESGKPFIFTSSQMAELQFSTYGILKLIGEKITKDIGGLAVRLWNVYGPEKEGDKSHVISDFCRMGAAGQINMMTNGAESRQFLYVEDFAECVLTLTEMYDKLDKSKNYHVSSFEWSSILDVAKIVSEISGSPIIIGEKVDAVQINAMNPPDDYILQFWKPRTSLKEGILKTYEGNRNSIAN